MNAQDVVPIMANSHHVLTIVQTSHRIACNSIPLGLPLQWHRDKTAGRIRGRPLQRINAEVLRKQPLCVRCLEFGRIKLAEVVDHITPLAKEKVQDNPYLPRQGLCRRCHDAKTASDFGLRQRTRVGADGYPIED
jgi:5-methylcytosine-specific restriction protein A